MVKSIKNLFQKEVLQLKTKPRINQEIVQMFLQRIDQGDFSREENKADHFCSFFLPFDPITNSVYIGHHKKADDWIPPGGHIDKGEAPKATVYREFAEELRFTLTNEPVTLFDISIIPVRKTKRACKTHYDFWYIVPIGKIDFDFDRKEFYDAKWFSLKDGIKMIKRDAYREIIGKLDNITV